MKAVEDEEVGRPMMATSYHIDPPAHRALATPSDSSLLHLLWDLNEGLCPLFNQIENNEGRCLNFFA